MQRTEQRSAMQIQHAASGGDRRYKAFRVRKCCVVFVGDASKGEKVNQRIVGILLVRTTV